MCPPEGDLLQNTGPYIRVRIHGSVYGDLQKEIFSNVMQRLNQSLTTEFGLTLPRVLPRDDPDHLLADTHPDTVEVSAIETGPQGSDVRLLENMANNLRY